MDAAADALSALFARHRRWLVLSGAGVSIASGIPGYRDADGQWMRSAPILLQDFLRDERARRRYWARSMAGWPAVAQAKPNAAHLALAALQARGRISRLVTQNVDGLHQRAGSTDVIELHGALDRVRCRDCGALHSRVAVQAMLERDNPQLAGIGAELAPDGDAHAAAHEGFRVPACTGCAGMLKPDVVFFGEGVPRERVDAAREALCAADALLVVGSSLMVYSGYRFCEWAAAMAKPIVAVNPGRTRADPLLTLKVMEACADALGRILAQQHERTEDQQGEEQRLADHQRHRAPS